MSFFETLPKKRIASAALFLNAQNEILLVKPIYQEHWLLPGSVVEEGESPRQACIIPGGRARTSIVLWL